MGIVAATARLLDPIDWLRRRWLRALGPLARPLMIDRELRVALVATTAILSALAASLLIPFWLLALGPIVWGVPHLLADLRYLVVGPGYHRRPLLVLLCAPPIIAVGLGADLSVGLLAGAGAALVARASHQRRIVALLAIGGLALAVMAAGRTADLIFAHLHNFIAVALWWLWRPRGRLHWIPLALFVAASIFLMSSAGLDAILGSAGLGLEAGHLGLDYQLRRLAGDVPADLGIRLVILFAFTQAIHYVVWLHLIPDDDRRRTTPPTFARSYRELCRDLGVPVVAVAIALCLLFAGWSLVDLVAAEHGYFRVARFHGHLEITAAILLLLEGRRPWSP